MKFYQRKVFFLSTSIRLSNAERSLEEVDPFFAFHTGNRAALHNARIMWLKIDDPKIKTSQQTSFCSNFGIALCCCCDVC